MTQRICTMTLRTEATHPAGRWPALRFEVITVRDMERRRFLLVLAAGLASASAGHGVSELLGPDRAPSPAPKATPETAAQSVAQPAAAKAPAAAQGLVPVVPPAGAVDALPGDGTSLALTIDDGTNTATAFGGVSLPGSVEGW